MMLRNGINTPPGVRTARQSKQSRDASKKCQTFNKAWLVGDKLSVFFPIVWCPNYLDNEIVMEQEYDRFGKPVLNEDGSPKMVQSGEWNIPVYDVWGHKVNDMKALGLKTTFIPSLTEIYGGRPVKFVRDEYGEVVYDDFGLPQYTPVEGDITYQFSKIAPLFIKGMKQEELSKVYNGKFSNEEFRRKALTDIENKYDTTKSMDAPKPIIDKCRLNTVCEVVAVTVDSNNNYKVDKAANYSFPLSDEKIDDLTALINDRKYRPTDIEQTWFEVQMTFNGDSNDVRGRSQAGRNAHPVGLSEEFTMKSVRPDLFEKIKAKVTSLPKSPSAIAQHTFLMNRIPEQKVLSALSYYIAANATYLDQIAEEEDMSRMMDNAYYLIKFAALDSMDREDLKTKIVDSYNEFMEDHPDMKPAMELTEDREDYTAPDLDHMPSTKELLAGQDDLMGDVESMDDILA